LRRFAARFRESGGSTRQFRMPDYKSGIAPGRWQDVFNERWRML